MKRIAFAVFTIATILVLTSCGSGSSKTAAPVVVALGNTFAFIGAGASAVTITAQVTGPGSDQGVSWELSVANTNCSPGCGTLAPAPTPSMSAVYTPPKNVPTNETATITARAIADPTQTFVFNFQITPGITILITDKFTTQTVGGPVTDIHAQVTNDATNAGLTWTLTAAGADCQPGCGTLTTDPAPSLVAHYQPPATPPTGAAANPTISAISVATPAIKDSFNFTIGAPPIAVSITNKFASQPVGGPATTVNATVANDFGNAGLTWTLTAAGADCQPACGTLVVGTPSTSATYTPPTTLPTGSAAQPTITATSVADTTKSDSFSFAIANASTALNGQYAFLVRGFNMAGTSPLAIAGAFVADGTGGISNAEFELNNAGSVVSFPAPMTGTYVVDSTFNGIPRVTITFASTPVNLVLKCALSSDGKRGQVTQVDDSGFLTSGILLQQDPAALTADPGGNYAFGVDSDAPVGLRIVEAGQFILGAGGASITGGLADAIQFAGANPIAGDIINGGAAISAGAATAPDSFGRGTLTLNVGGTGDVQYSYYVIDGQRLNLLEIDGGTALNSLFSGTAQRQKTLDANSINSTAVVALTGMSIVNGTTVVPDTAIGVFTISGTTAAVTYDRNTGSGVSILQQVTGSIPSSIPTAAFDPATGRVLLANTIVTGTVLYYYDTGKAYAIDFSPNSASRALSGQLVPQTAGPFSASNLAGNSIGRAGGSSTAGPANADFAATFDGTANYSFKLDLTTTNASLGSNGQVIDFSTSDIFQINDATSGHGVLRLLGGVLGDPNASAGDIVSFYLIGPNQFVAIGNTAGVPSGVLYFDPQ
jgi:hypothetical protein